METADNRNLASVEQLQIDTEHQTKTKLVTTMP